VRPEAIFLAAAKVGGILANDTLPADFLYDNLMIEANIIEAAHSAAYRQAAVPGVELHLSEVRAAADPEDALLTGPLEPTNEWYAIAKIAGIKLCQAYRRSMAATSSRPCRPTSTVPAIIST
jgi:GDP-L-fucose synthase